MYEVRLVDSEGTTVIGRDATFVQAIARMKLNSAKAEWTIRIENENTVHFDCGLLESYQIVWTNN